MICYKCGNELSDKDFCTSCGVDVKLYKRIMFISNMFYNEGLNRANVRDLSGAVESLRQSLKFNKNNIDARNLLGLVYFEMGESVAALSEWVISKNIRPTKNIADDYINDIQSDPTRLETINQSIKKFNLAIDYCYQDSVDLAIIQLKKVISVNPHFVKAYLLLALLYLNAEEWDKARKVLKKCLKIDLNNTTGLRYLKEAEFMLGGDENPIGRKKRITALDPNTYQSGNELIIQPSGRREPIIGSSVLINILIGFAIGMAVCFFLILPARVQSARSEIEEELKVISENADEKTADITALESQIAALTDENEKLRAEKSSITGEGGVLQSFDGLINAAKAYVANPDDLDTVADGLYTIDSNLVEAQNSEAYKGLYQSMMQAVGGRAATHCFESGMALKNQGDYTGAIEQFLKSWYFDSSNPETLYQMGLAYQQSGNMDKANEIYNQLVTAFPDSEFTQMAQENIADANRASSNGDASAETQTENEQDAYANELESTTTQ